MVGSPRITWTLVAVLAVHLLKTASAEVAEEVCAPPSVEGAGDYEECAPSPKRGTELIQTAKRASLAGQGQSDAKQNHSSDSASLAGQSQSDAKQNHSSDGGRGDTYYCWEVNPWDDDCWKKKPSSDTTPDCTADSGETPCRCKTGECRFDLLSSSTPTTAKCVKKEIYLVGGTYSNDAGSVSEVRGTGMEIYCLKMVKTADWSSRHIIKRSSDGPERDDSKWCDWDWNYMWKDGEQGCFRKTRYLGEKCWDKGDCAGTKDELTSCADGTCVPKGFEPSTSCRCAWGAGADALICNSKRDCQNHACVMSLEGDSRYCDFGKVWYS